MEDARCSHRAGGLLRRRSCGLPATGQCVYCSEPFCDVHGIHGEDYYQICERSRCQAKWQDLAHHKEWVARHYHDNIAGYCAAEDCAEALEMPCERCSLRYCMDHIRPTTIKVMELSGVEEVRSFMLCPHCIERRRIWD